MTVFVQVMTLLFHRQAEKNICLRSLCWYDIFHESESCLPFTNLVGITDPLCTYCSSIWSLSHSHTHHLSPIRDVLIHFSLVLWPCNENQGEAPFFYLWNLLANKMASELIKRRNRESSLPLSQKPFRSRQEVSLNGPVQKECSLQSELIISAQADLRAWGPKLRLWHPSWGEFPQIWFKMIVHIFTDGQYL